MVERNLAQPYPTLQRFARRAMAASAPIEERCELCAEPVPEEHRHLADVASRGILCVCRACSILFDKEAASQGKYRLIPDRSLYLDGFRLSDARWDSLRIPVGMAFFFHSTPVERVVAFFPSPMGPTESLLHFETWAEIERDNPVLGTMRPDVEALLVNRARGAREHFLVPVDACYQLVSILRHHWKGFSGGEEVWREMDRFFTELRARSTIIYAAS